MANRFAQPFFSDDIRTFYLMFLSSDFKMHLTTF